MSGLLGMAFFPGRHNAHLPFSLCSRFIGWLLSALRPELHSDVGTGNSTISPKVVASYAKKLAETDLELVKSTSNSPPWFLIIDMPCARSPRSALCRPREVRGARCSTRG